MQNGDGEYESLSVYERRLLEQLQQARSDVEKMTQKRRRIRNQVLELRAIAGVIKNMLDRDGIPARTEIASDLMHTVGLLIQETE